MRKWIAIAFACLALVACAGVDVIRDAETIEQKYYAVISIYDIADEEALALAKKPDTPPAVVSALTTASEVTYGTMTLLREAFVTYQEAKLELADLPNQTALDEVQVALTVVNRRLPIAIERVNDLRSLVEENL